MREYKNLIYLVTGTLLIILINLTIAVSSESTISCNVSGFCSYDLFQSVAANNLIIPFVVSFSLMIRGLAPYIYNFFKKNSTKK